LYANILLPELAKNEEKLAKLSIFNQKNIENNNNLNNEMLNDLNKNICNYCKKTYSDKYALQKHITRCKTKKLEDAKKDENIMLKKEIDLLKQQMAEIINKPQVIQNITNNNNTVNNNNGVINNVVGFGKEDLSTLSKKQVNTIVNKMLSKSGAGVFWELADNVHFNDEYPQYKNFSITDKNRKQVNVNYGDNKVKCIKLENFIPSFIQNIAFMTEKLLELVNDFNLKYKNMDRLNIPIDISNYDPDDKPDFEDFKNLDEYKSALDYHEKLTQWVGIVKRVENYIERFYANV
jgi:hypothetical protein